jgi:iron complex transport system permease protein
VAISLIFLLSRGVHISSLGMILAAFVGALLAMSFVLLLSLKVKNSSILVVCGILIGYICSAITDFVVTFADDSNIVNLHNWSMGSFSGINSKDVKIMSVVILACLVFVFFLSKPIGAYRLGESYAANMGVNVKALRIALILSSSLLAATVTAFAGPISFVGIAIPHLVKSLSRTSSPYVMIPACFLGGAVITLFCDGIARTVFAPTEVSISSVTAFFLVPVVIVVMLRRKKIGEVK